MLLLPAPHTDAQQDKRTPAPPADLGCFRPHVLPPCSWRLMRDIMGVER
jgi:hypothetical protein